MSQAAGNERQVVIVLGPGRSGTSLAMQVLHSLGMQLSPKLLPGSAGNPKGFLEDEEIVNLHKALMQKLDLHPGDPVPDNWYHGKEARTYISEFQKVIDTRLSAIPGVWGFKDPRTATFLPLWHRALNRPGIIPVYILAVRHPATVVASLRAETDRSVAANELLWLERTVDALYYTGGDCFIVHYEDWFIRSEELAEELSAYTGLNQESRGTAGAAVRAVINRALNRAVQRKPGLLENPRVHELYRELEQCRDAHFDRDRLMAGVREIRDSMEKDGRDASGGIGPGAKRRSGSELYSKSTKWQLGGAAEERGYNENEIGAKAESMMNINSSQAESDYKLRADSENPNAIRRVELAEGSLSAMREDLQALIAENSHKLAEIKKLHDQVEEIRTINAALAQEKKQLSIRVQRLRSQAKGVQGKAQTGNNASEPVGKDAKRLAREVVALRNSYSYQIGQAFADGLMKPGFNTIKVPFRVAALLWNALRNRKSIGKIG